MLAGMMPLKLAYAANILILVPIGVPAGLRSAAVTPEADTPS